MPKTTWKRKKLRNQNTSRGQERYRGKGERRKGCSTHAPGEDWEIHTNPETAGRDRLCRRGEKKGGPRTGRASEERGFSYPQICTLKDAGNILPRGEDAAGRGFLAKPSDASGKTAKGKKRTENDR